MKLKNKKRLLDELARESENPKEFIRGIMALQQQTAESITQNVDMTPQHFYVAMNQLNNGQSIGVKTCVKIANGLDISPIILYRVITDYSIKQYLNSLENGIHQNNKRKTAD